MNKTHNKILLFGILILSIFNCTGQENGTANPEINSENYYDYHTSGATVTNWIRRNEAVPIIIDELGKLGFETFQYVMFELNDGEQIILDVYNRKNNIGIVFNTSHFMTIKKEQRNSKTYNQDKFKISGSLGKRKVYDSLPKNIIVLQETWYWYQTKNNSSEKLVNKKTAENILREDIRNQIAELKK